MGAPMINPNMPPPKLAGGPLIMGVLNVTPDSFSDGGKWQGAAVPHALAMLEAGADIIDVGGESTRPGAPAVDEQEEIARVVPVIASLRAATRAPISIDTMKPGRRARRVRRRRYDLERRRRRSRAPAARIRPPRSAAP